MNPSLILEIGVLSGGSLRAWKEIFPTAKIVGIDINEEAGKNNPDLSIFIGDQLDKLFLNEVIARIGVPDLIIDDGGHSRLQQVTTFKHLFPKLNAGGLYVIEDIETSYMEAYDDSPQSIIQTLADILYPTNFDGNTKGRKVGDRFAYLYSSLTVKHNICLVMK
ncbi:class I SAM-dependent methyltransferase [Candidatus Bathyarchaeota archaeon]|nr:class I SAM-dependent methyltransferase [Candidatus Bathyarchaeota archaeon]